MKPNFLIAFAVCILCSFNNYLQAQKKNKGISDVGRYNPRFSYSPAQRDSIANTGITIALLKPVFIDNDINQAGTPWDEFSKAMATDVEELLTAKGFKVRGPFNTADEMVFSDKQNSDFVIQISIDMNIRYERKWKTKYNILFSTTTYLIDKADVTLNSNVILTAVSCFTSEKIWKKNLDISNKSFSYNGSERYDAEPTFFAEMKRDVNLWNPMSKNLEDIYKGAFDILWKQFDKNEMKNVSKEAKKSDGARRN